MSQDPLAGVPPVNMEGSQAQKIAKQQAAHTKQIAQEVSQDSLQSFIDEGAFSPTLMARRFQSLETRRKSTPKEEEADAAKREERVVAIEKVEKAARDFSRRNPELEPRSLSLLRSQIGASDTKEQILQKVLSFYPDPWLADEALDFLLETSEGSLKEQIRLAKEDLNAKHARDVKAGKNIRAETQEFAKQGLAAPPQLRTLYREITTNPRDAHTLFNEFSEHFDYERLLKVAAFLLHALGSDLKSKGPSIDRGELHRLFSEARKLQAILGVFRFFQGRMDLIRAAFQRQGLAFSLNFEALAKQFMRAIQERYPSIDRIFSLASKLGISEELAAQIIIFTQMRDAIRQIAPKLFRSNQHRQDVLYAFLDAIEELDEQLEEDKEDKEEEEND